MSHLKAGNTKLRDRAVRIVMAETGVDRQRAKKALEDCAWIVTDAVKQCQ